MAKEWILNSAMNRFQLNFKRNVGPTSESIRRCAPRTIDEWREYYFSNVRPIEHIIEIGRKLYTKITEVISAENVDFFIKIKDKFIGLQIKPVSQGIQLSQIFKEKGLQQKTHEKFADEFGGSVFYIFSSKTNGKKVIMNPEVIKEIRTEIKRLNQ